MISTSEAFARALLLVELELLDSRVSDLDERSALLTAMEWARIPDEATVRLVVDQLMEQNLTFLELVDEVCDHVLFEQRRGLPLLRSGVLPRRLIRILDPDGMATLCSLLHARKGDQFDWPAVPIDDTGPTSSLLRDGSVETHIHLGGALPPVFYWLLLMGCELGTETLHRIRSNRRGHAPTEAWQRAVMEASWSRLALAWTVQRAAAAKVDIPGFRHLPFYTDPVWKPFSSLEDPPDNLTIRNAVLALSRPLRETRDRWRLRSSDQLWDWPYSDPLRPPPEKDHRAHYAAGERQLLHHLSSLLRSSLDCRDTGRFAVIEKRLLAYLRIRNAFHHLMVHGDGSYGLLRFVENFSRRGFASGRSRRRRSLRRKRFRRNLIDLERSRMSEALRTQLVDPFGDARAAGMTTVSRGIEMRVSVPARNLLLRTLRCWIEGIADYLRSLDSDSETDFARVGLLFHLIKTNPAGEQRALESAERLYWVLRGYPKLRPFVIGLDAAGDERAAPPRVFTQAFQFLQKNVADIRPRRPQLAIRLGYTFHVGEDVTDLLTGLRHMDEVVTLFLPQGEGGRLGHALALGEDVRNFYTRRAGATEPPAGSHLLDLIWAWGRLDGVGRSRAHSWIPGRILSLIDSPEVNESNLGLCYRQMGLETITSRRSTPLSEADLLDILGFQGDLRKPILCQAEERWLALVSELQKWLREKFLMKRLCIEANPTSNLLIGGFNDYHDLPYHTLVDAGFPVSINTDDPGLFMTSLPAEYAALYEAYEGMMPHRQILAWLADRRFDAEQNTFLRAPLLIPQASAADLDSLFSYSPG